MDEKPRGTDGIRHLIPLNTVKELCRLSRENRASLKQYRYVSLIAVGFTLTVASQLVKNGHSCGVLEQVVDESCQESLKYLGPEDDLAHVPVAGTLGNVMHGFR